MPRRASSRRRIGRFVSTPVSPTISGVPVIVGTPQVSIPADYTPASVSGTTPITRSIRWLLDGVNQGSTYTPGVGTDGQTLQVEQTETNAWGFDVATSAGVVIIAAPPEPVAPAYVAGFAGQPVILGQPYVGATCGVLAGVISLGSPAPTKTYQWYRRDFVDGTPEAITGATNSTYTFTNADILREVICRETATNASGNASVDSWWVTCLPAGYSIGQGADTAAYTSDPATAAAYSAATLYRAGNVVDVSGTKYYLAEPFSYGIDPSVNKATENGGFYWYAIAATYYIDFSLGVGADTTGSGTSASPWGSLDAVRKKVTSGTSGYSAAAANSLFLFKRGTTAATYGQINITAAANKPLFFGAYGSTSDAKPIIPLAPNSPAEKSVYAAFGNLIRVQNSDGAQPRSCVYTDLDLRGGNLMYFSYTNSVGVLGVGNVVTFANGAYGTIRHLHTSNTGVLFAWVEVVPASTTPNSGAFTVSGGGSGQALSSATAVSGIGGFAGSTSRTTGWSAYRNVLTEFTGHGILAQGQLSAAQITQGDLTCMDNVISYSCTKTDNGAGIDGAIGLRGRIIRNRLYNNGSAGSTKNHNLYLGWAKRLQVLLNDCEMDANFGSSALVMHGHLQSVEIGYNRFKGSRVGLGINDGYASSETMTGLHIHHNLTEDIGQNGNSTQSLPWEITSIQSSRIHHNITRNCATSTAIYEGRSSGGDDTLLADIVFVHNIWDECGTSAMFYIGTTSDGTKALNIQSLYMKNNVFKTASGVVPFRKGYTMPSAQMTLDYNLYFRAGATATVITNNYGSGAANYDTADLFNAAVPQFETNGLTADPLFVNTATRDYNLGGASTARNAGEDVRRRMGMAADWTGAALNDTSPHIGALETA